MRYIKILSSILWCITISRLNAQTSNSPATCSPEQRESYIQKALAYRKEENYATAIRQLDTILFQQPSDAPVLLLKGDLQLESKLFKEAVESYKKLLPLNYERTSAQINLSYALFMNHRPSQALHAARTAWTQDKANTNAVVNLFNAFLWNIKTKEASKFLSQQQHLLTTAQVLVLTARLYTTMGDYYNGLRCYDSLVKTKPDKYYVQEYAEVLLGKKEMALASQTMDRGRQLFSPNEYNTFSEKLKAMKQQMAGTEFIYFRDGAKNIRIENIVWWQQKGGKKYRIGLKAGVSTISSAQNEKTASQFGHVFITERWNKTWSGQTDFILQHIQPFGSKEFVGLTGKQTVQYQPNDRRMFGLSYSADILNFTASLLQKNIRGDNIGYLTNIMLNGKTGFYSQGTWGVLSDRNQRYQFFGSVYHLFRTEPTLKGGINFSALHYNDSTIKNYFSPNRYLSSEIFADYSTALPNLSKFYLQLQAGAGLQQIEKMKLEPAFRFQSELGIRLKQIESSLKYQTSNVASVTGTGYKFNWFTLKLMWKW
jgi:tetratricopeptide (TPR) repeat protein